MDCEKTMSELFTASSYHSILCSDFPPFLHDYLQLPLLTRLKGVGLLCGTDWTELFHNQFFYSRFDHSLGVALIVWNFTHDKKQTLAGLLHDVSTRAFSHVTDFRNGDALTQESSEDINASLIDNDKELSLLLKRDGLTPNDVDDYHRYPVADNPCPGLSADRLEYMYPSGAALCGQWTIDEVRKNYSHVCLLVNEQGQPELGFDDEEAALDYTKRFTNIALLLQHNEDKIAMQLLADVVSRAIKCSFICEDDLFSLTEQELIERFDSFASQKKDIVFTRLHKTFRTMKEVKHTQRALDGHYCVSLAVKKRYVIPLVKQKDGSALRISDCNGDAKKIISDFLSYSDSPYGCVCIAQ